MWLCCSRSTFFLFAFVEFSFYQSAMSEQAGYCWLHGHGQWSSPALEPKQDTLHVWTPEVPIHTYSLCLLNYFFITKWHLPSFGFAVCFSCQNRSLFLCIVSSVTVINYHRYSQDSSKNVDSLLQQFPVHSGEGPRGLGLICTSLWLIKKPSLHLRTSWCHQTVRSLQYLYFITDGAKWTLAACQAALSTGSETDRPSCSKWVVWKKKTYCFWNLLCPILIVASGAQIRALCFGLVLFLTFDYGARIEGIVTHVLLCETLYRVYYYHF